MRRGSSRARPRRPSDLATAALFVALGALPCAAWAHPTAEELAHRARAAALCTRAANPDAWSDAIHLGMKEAELRGTWGEALEARSIEHRLPDFQRGLTQAEASKDASDEDLYADQLRLRRSLSEGDVRSVEYELFRGSIYRIRWRLAARFAVPVLADLVHQTEHCYGPPLYDQTVEAKLGSGEVTRRRIGWKRADRLLEIRQLNPLAGGPVFVTVTDLAASQDLIAARGSLAPEPERRAEPWWRRRGGPPASPGDEARSELVRAFAAALSRTDFQRALEEPPVPVQSDVEP